MHRRTDCGVLSAVCITPMRRVSPKPRRVFWRFSSSFCDTSSALQSQHPQRKAPDPKQAKMIRSNPTAVALRVSDLKHLQSELETRKATSTSNPSHNTTNNANVASSSQLQDLPGHAPSSPVAETNTKKAGNVNGNGNGHGRAEGSGNREGYNAVQANRAAREARTTAERIGL